jgi:hypothetical protein
LLWALAVLVCLAGCAREPGRKGWDGFTLVAGGDVADLQTQTSIEVLLNNNGIQSFVESSVVYGVYVRNADARRAVDLLSCSPFHQAVTQKGL